MQSKKSDCKCAPSARWQREWYNLVTHRVHCKVVWPNLAEICKVSIEGRWTLQEEGPARAQAWDGGSLGRAGLWKCESQGEGQREGHKMPRFYQDQAKQNKNFGFDLTDQWEPPPTTFSSNDRVNNDKQLKLTECLWCIRFSFKDFISVHSFNLHKLPFYKMKKWLRRDFVTCQRSFS